MPKRSEARRRTNKPKNPPARGTGARAFRRPAASRDWHPIARRWFESLAKSGQCEWYQPSDWSAAYVLAESMSREFKPQPVVDQKGRPVADDTGKPVLVDMPPRAAALSAWAKVMAGLLVTEGDRRRVSVELSKPKPEEAMPSGVSELDEYRRRLQPG